MRLIHIDMMIACCEIRSWCMGVCDRTLGGNVNQKGRNAKREQERVENYKPFVFYDDTRCS